MSLDQRSASVVEAYSDPLQRRILFALDGGSASARELAARFDTPATVVVDLLGLLEARGLVERAPADRPGDRADEAYRTRIPIELDDAEWAELPVATRQRLIDTITTEIIHGLSTSTEAGLSTADDTHVSRLVLKLDAAGRTRVNTWLAALIDQCVAEQRASDARSDRTTAPRPLHARRAQRRPRFARHAPDPLRPVTDTRACGDAFVSVGARRLLWIRSHVQCGACGQAVESCCEGVAGCA